MPSIQSTVSAAIRTSKIVPASVWIISALTVISLLSRLPLLSISLEEVDSANFVNSLLNGYNIPLLRPHPPGYPVYMFLGWLLDSIVNNPHLSLTLLSAFLGSLAVVPLYLILKGQTSSRMATVGSILFLANPLFWSFSEAGLSDVPSMFFVLVLAWLSLRARTSGPAFLLACVMCSLAIGIRQANIFSLIFVIFPVAYRLVSDRKVPWLMGATGAAILVTTTLAWVLPMIFLGSDGFLDYAAALEKQWANVIIVSDIFHVESPVLLNAIIRVERFGSGYLLSHLWLGSNSNDLASLLFLAPWVFGFGLFVMGFRLRNPGHVFVAIWLASVVYTIVSIHFLPRYGLAQFPAFLIACLMGYQFLATQLAIGKLRLEALIFVIVGCVLLIGAIRMQPAIPAFEVTPPPGSLTSLLLAVSGAASLLAARYLQFRDRALRWSLPMSLGRETPLRWLKPEPVILVCLMILAIPVAAKGYSLASIAHTNENPIQQMVELVRDTYGTDSVTPCWDSQTHSFFELLDPESKPLVPVGYWSTDELYEAYRAGHTLLITDQCKRYGDIDANIGLTRTGQFSGDSPLWAKVPTLTLFATASRRSDVSPLAVASPPEGSLVLASASPVAAYFELPQGEPDPFPAALAQINEDPGPDPSMSLASLGATAESETSNVTTDKGLNPSMSLASLGATAKSESGNVATDKGLDSSMSPASLAATAETETTDIQRFIRVEPLTPGPLPDENRFFGLPTVTVLVVLAVLVSIALVQAVRTW